MKQIIHICDSCGKPAVVIAVPVEQDRVRQVAEDDSTEVIPVDLCATCAVLAMHHVLGMVTDSQRCEWLKRHRKKAGIGV